ncbi:hypothetical protein [Hoeflea prorocentri]|uniref:Uncharacterized protein n=1 Tax=Hoeflea prorocentri TaxID=1922333 RepID=A0A9X3UFC4_9HYPH|nr:hypothetical protein [Hoeflea prorocentri]MCY6380237.1 hypothetical protein [Hoeflea prorocentri]MDA5398037.1 hypothetical protein [Hoeflea prorocentri]
MDLSAPINELKRKAKIISRETGLAHSQALDCVAGEEGYATWSLLIRKYEDQKPNPVQSTSSGYLIESLPVDDGYRVEAIALANSTFEEVFRRIEPDNPKATRELWNASDYVDNHHLRNDMLPIDSEYALSLIEVLLVHYVIDLATKADGLFAEPD